VQKEEEGKMKELVSKNCFTEKINLEIELTLQQKLFLGLFIKVSQMDDTNDLKAPTNNVLITPTPEFFLQSIDYLLTEQLILPSINSPEGAFYKNEEDELSFNQSLVLYSLNVESADGDYAEMIQRLIYPNSDEFLKDKEYCYDIWKVVAVGETMSYLLCELRKNYIEYSSRKREFQVFNYLLKEFSIAQIYNFIYRAVANATMRLRHGDLSEEAAVNSIITHIENYGKRASIDKWDIEPYHRVSSSSVLTKMVFYDILGISDLGFEVVPTSDL